MRQGRPISMALAVALVVLLALPAVASAADASADFEARVNAQNKEMYSFTIDHDHIDYFYSVPDRALPLLSGSQCAGDHNITVANTGAMPFDLFIQASSEPTATDGVNEYTVPLAESDGAFYSAIGSSTGSGIGMGRAGWLWFVQGTPHYGDRALWVAGSAARLTTVDSDEQAIIETDFMAPTHWPHGTALDYNWGGTLIAAPVDPV